MGETFYLSKNLENANRYDSYIVVNIYFRPQLQPKRDEMIEQAKLMVKEYMNELYGA